MNKDKLIEFIKAHGIDIAQRLLNAYTSEGLPSVSEVSQEQMAEVAGIEEAKYQDGDAFVENLQNDLLSLNRLGPEQIATLMFSLTKKIGEVYQFCEAQETKRVNINAQRDVLIKQIEARKEIVMRYLDKSFDERKENFAKLFSLVDKAVTTHNNEQLALALQSINLLAAESPFKALQSVTATQKALEDKNHEWDF